MKAEIIYLCFCKCTPKNPTHSLQHIILRYKVINYHVKHVHIHLENDKENYPQP